MPAAATEPAQKHAALIWLIRGTGALFVSLIVLFVGALVAGTLIQSANYFRHPEVRGDHLSLIMRISGLLVCVGLIIVIPCVCVKWARGIFRKVKVQKAGFFWKVDASSVSNFAFFFAAFASHDFYQLMPAQLPEFIHAYPLAMTLLNREVLWLVVFWILWYGAKAILLRVLELKPLHPPQNQPPIDPETPEFPRKSPLVQM